MVALNSKFNSNNPVWSGLTTTTTAAASSTSNHVAITQYAIIDNQSGGNIQIRPSGGSNGVSLAPGESFSVAFETGTKFDIVNSGAAVAVLLWLE